MRFRTFLCSESNGLETRRAKNFTGFAVCCHLVFLRRSCVPCIVNSSNGVTRVQAFLVEGTLRKRAIPFALDRDPIFAYGISHRDPAMLSDPRVFMRFTTLGRE